jgi:hypothetical protein
LDRRGDAIYLRSKTWSLRIIAAIGTTVMLVSPAWAASAWVRWLNDPVPTDSWFRENAFDTRRDCVRTLDVEQQGYEKIHYKVQRENDTALVVFRFTGTAFLLRCLPDTIDPRGAKGK